MESTVAAVAVAVSASTALAPRLASSRPRHMYAGRKLCDHSERQCACARRRTRARAKSNPGGAKRTELS
eukprot:5288448-Pleurochrysis_carterae.AAC.1